ncbi:peptidase inhibitor family I36 protein [Streptomyces sp. NPDC005820]|uniref:peptidase inhibitor family I36 protein n=1 Tax=Streptomyces sp. NPDC005820 TaxID=3157069 RepID=UPI0033EFDACB
MMLKRIVRRAAVPAAMTAALAGGTLAAAPSASAAESDCPAAMVCVFQDIYFQGRMVGQTDPYRSNIGDYMNDRTSSIVNRTDRDICFYQNIDYQGDMLMWIPARSAAGVLVEGANDRISSFKPCW